MAELTGTLIAHRKRLEEIAAVLVRNGLGPGSPRGSGLLDARRCRSCAITSSTPAWTEPLRGRTAAERPDRARHDVDQVRADAEPASRRRRCRRRRRARAAAGRSAGRPAGSRAANRRGASSGKPLPDLYEIFEAEPFASGSVAQVHRATLPTGQPSRSRSSTTGPRSGCARTSSSWRGSPPTSRAKDPELAQLRPTILVDEFAKMMQGAIDLREELRNLQRFRANFADEPDVVIPTPYPDRLELEGAHDVDAHRRAVHRPGRASRRRAGTSTRSCSAPPTSTWR